MIRKPKFKDYALEEQRDKFGKIPKLGDYVRFTLYDGVENVVTQITKNEFDYHKPYLLCYLEFEIFDGVLNEDDILLEEITNL